MKQYIITITIALMFFGCAQKIPPVVLKYDQSTQPLLQTEVEPINVNLENFYSRVFYPWSIDKIAINAKRASWANTVFVRPKKYYAENILLWEEKPRNKIIENTNFEKYNTKKLYALTIRTVQQRNLPTHKPFYLKTTLPGEGFPFDYMQNTLLHVNTPLFISHYSKDGAWAYVQNPVSSGWLPTKSFIIVDAKQRDKFINSKKLVITTDNNPIYSTKNEYMLHAKLGSMFPIEKEDDSYYYSYIYTRFQKIDLKISKEKSNKMPLDYNRENIIKITTELLGEKYGWGGYLENRDCSAMTKDVLAPFGLWLPRNSASQKKSGEYILLKDLKIEEKEKMIIENGIPFLSLIYLRGHIMLYVGAIDGKAMIMHNTWGIKTEIDGHIGRYVIGRTVISDLHLGEDLDSVKKDSLLINRVDGLVIRPDFPKYDKNKFAKAYPSITRMKENRLHFKDNSSLIYDDYIEKSYENKIRRASIKDTISLKYDSFTEILAPNIAQEAGRFRNQRLLKKLYGHNKKEIIKNLETVKWIDGSNLLFNKQQNASIQLQKVSNELKRLPIEYKKYITNIAGTFNYRKILNTNRLSTHSFGIAIDLNVKKSAYWKWDKKYKYRNQIPKEIVEIFEKHGFIWGGRWYHYDTMHFEYRPEFFASID